MMTSLMQSLGTRGALERLNGSQQTRDLHFTVEMMKFSALYTFDDDNQAAAKDCINY